MKLTYSIALLISVLIFTGCVHDTEETGDTGTVASSANVETQLSKAVTAQTSVVNAKELQNNLVDVQNIGSIPSFSSAYNETKTTGFMLKTLVVLTSFEGISVNKSPSFAPLSLNETTNCSVSGTKTIVVNGDTNNILPDYTKITFSSCNEDGIILNGQAEITFSSDGLSLSSQTLTYLTDFSLQGNGIPGITIKGGSRIIIDQMQLNGSGFRLNQTAIIEVGSRTYGSKNLIYMFSNVNTISSYYPVSGREYINNITDYFDVDTSYDASITPFVVSASGFQVGGLFKYIGANAKKLEIEITGINEVTVRADVNGDGIFDFNTETEVYSIN
ncbi:hypothetical protein JHD50_10350 [Sulfurimonas sp. MAG313]|nr:hypothetical protein [Sulfurimonas sp. MAG313]MDF1881693.1 hypothetical protein [Sulfurimonas sp. MAG313]